jgi:predicted AlkP superfamily phosphohydrolase/phosphomutase
VSTQKVRTCLLVIVALLLGGTSCERGPAGDSGPRVLVLGFDGMDYGLTKELMAAGRLPHFQHLADVGTFAPLETAVPPQSPVAWSDFITGTDAGGHGIFDFVHRDPKTMLPYESTSRTEPGRSIRLGSWRIPISGGRVVLLRHGTAFWERLSAHHIPATIVRIPANFPPSGTATRELSGMGTPDILGTYGTFTFYTGNPTERAVSKVSGGRIVAVRPLDGKFSDVLQGPPNPFRTSTAPLTAAFTVFADPQEPYAKLVVGAEERLLEVGSWSDWVPIDFPMAPTKSLRGMCRFYLKQLRPYVALYATPVNIDPLQPAMPISHPDDWAAQLARSTGRFYTQGMPEDTKALFDGVFDAREFLAQAHLALEENLRQYHEVLGRFDRGLLFYYFGSTDQVSHMMWRAMDPGHPAYDAATDAPFADVIPQLYVQMDSIVGATLEHLGPKDLLVVMSDHGFASWRRSFNLNGWLRDHGYLAVRDSGVAEDAGVLSNIDWAHTRAYGLGLNGLYVNVAGRERWGIVPAGERGALLDEIGAKLLATIDPKTGQPAVTGVYRSDTYYASKAHLDLGPDLIVGYAKGTRCSDASGIGSVPREVFTDNTGAWSADHCMDHTSVPGILFTSRRLQRPARRLQDLAASLLVELGVDTPEAHDTSD